MSELEAVFTVKCAGGCGRESQTQRVTELWTPQYCPDCRKKEAEQALLLGRCAAGSPDA